MTGDPRIAAVRRIFQNVKSPAARRAVAQYIRERRCFKARRARHAR